MMTKKICVFDFETDGSDPEVCDPVQLASVVIDPVSLDIIPGSEFNINFKPMCLDHDQDYVYKTDILGFHAKVKGCSQEDVLNLWRGYPKQDQSWKQFINYLDKYHIRSSSKGMFSAPIAAGYNIIKFDMKIINRLSIRYGNTNKESNTNLFYPRDTIDIMNIAWLWFENIQEVTSLSLDSVREYLGIDKTGAHDAMKDVKDCADILIRFLRLHISLSEKIKFKDSFK